MCIRDSPRPGPPRPARPRRAPRPQHRPLHPRAGPRLGARLVPHPRPTGRRPRAPRLLGPAGPRPPPDRARVLERLRPGQQPRGGGAVRPVRDRRARRLPARLVRPHPAARRHRPRRRPGDGRARRPRRAARLPAHPARRHQRPRCPGRARPLPLPGHPPRRPTGLPGRRGPPRPAHGDPLRRRRGGHQCAGRAAPPEHRRRRP